MLERGQMVTLVSGGGDYPLIGFKNGNQYIVDIPKHTDHPEVRNGKADFVVKINRGHSGSGGYATMEQLGLGNELDKIKGESKAY